MCSHQQWSKAYHPDENTWQSDWPVLINQKTQTIVEKNISWFFMSSNHLSVLFCFSIIMKNVADLCFSKHIFWLHSLSPLILFKLNCKKTKSTRAKIFERFLRGRNGEFIWPKKIIELENAHNRLVLFISNWFRSSRSPMPAQLEIELDTERIDNVASHVRCSLFSRLVTYIFADISIVITIPIFHW